MNNLIKRINEYFIELNIKQVIAYIISDKNSIPFFIYPSDNLSIVEYDNFKYTKHFLFDYEYNKKIKITFSFDNKIENENIIFDFLNYFIISHYKNYLFKINNFAEELFFLFISDNLNTLNFLEKDFIDKIIIHLYNVFIKNFNFDFIKFNIELKDNNINKILDNNSNSIEVEDFNNIIEKQNINIYHLVNCNINNNRFFIDLYLYKNDYFIKLITKDEEIKNKIEKHILDFITIILILYQKEKYIAELSKIIDNFKKELELKNIKILNEINKATYIEKSREILFSNLYHELLTPLNSIIGFSSLLNSEIDFLDNDENKFLAPIYHNALYLKNILLVIIDYSQYFSNKDNFICNEFEFKNLINDLNEILSFFNFSFNSNVKISLININNDLKILFDFNKLEELLFSTTFFLIKRKIKEFNINFIKNENILIEFIINNHPSLNTLVSKLLKTLNNKKFIIDDNNDISEFLFVVMHEIFHSKKINFKLEITEYEVKIIYELANLRLK